MENRVKVLETEIINMKSRMNELKNLLTDIYVHYEYAELKKDIERFENSAEIKNKLNPRMVEKCEEMKRMLPLVKEYNNLKELEEVKTNEKAEIIKICKGSIQTLNLLSNYYKTLKKKSVDENSNQTQLKEVHSKPISISEGNPCLQTEKDQVKIDKNFSTFRSNDKKAKFGEKDNRPKSANSNKK